MYDFIYVLFIFYFLLFHYYYFSKGAQHGYLGSAPAVVQTRKIKRNMMEKVCVGFEMCLLCSLCLCVEQGCTHVCGEYVNYSAILFF